MKKGILRDFVWSYVTGLGYLAIEDCETHKVDMVTCDGGPAIGK